MVGFAPAADRQHLQALLQRDIRSGLCSPETPNIIELAESIDDALSNASCTTRTMSCTISSLNGANLYARPRHHDRQLSIPGQLRNRNFIYRMLLQGLLLTLFIGLRSFFHSSRKRTKHGKKRKRSRLFTARCTLVQSAVLRSHVVCLSVCLSVCL